MTEFRWRRVSEREIPRAEDFFREQEQYCVSACSRFHQGNRRDHLWALTGRRRGSPFLGLLLHHNRMLFPALSPGLPKGSAPAPGFLDRLVMRIALHAVHGLTADTEFLAASLQRLGLSPRSDYRYDLFRLAGPPPGESLRRGPAAISVRRPEFADLDELFLLQAAYEREEVLPEGAALNPAACRLHVQRLLAEEYFLAARLDGKIVGKINTNAASYSCRQIGGVYVLPEYRGRGIAQRLTAELAAQIAPRGETMILFVKKGNAAALRAYRKTGFEKIGDYRICYY